MSHFKFCTIQISTRTSILFCDTITITITIAISFFLLFFFNPILFLFTFLYFLKAIWIYLQLSSPSFFNLTPHFHRLSHRLGAWNMHNFQTRQLAHFSPFGIFLLNYHNTYSAVLLACYYFPAIVSQLLSNDLPRLLVLLLKHFNWGECLL